MLECMQPDDIKTYSEEELLALCEEIRQTIIDRVGINGGHLASNLGAVELSVALCRAFSFPSDKIVFDVGHQCYAYKLLTGRYEKFATLRKKDGLSGFPKRTESGYDAYDTGHAGTALSAAIGLAKARDLKGENHTVIAFIGDGSFNNGLIYEALNSLKIVGTRVLIILNDNDMSISPTVGGMHDILSNIKQGDRQENIRLLESFSLSYIGVKDGNDVLEMLQSLDEAKELLKEKSVLLHVHTKKGKGYAFSEDNPSNTHGVSPAGANKEKEYSEVLGETLTSLAEEDPRVCVVTAAMTDSLGLAKFFKEYPERSFDVGICEENACVLCSSLAVGGLKPYYAIYSTFLQRAFDEIIHDVCAQDLPVTFCIDRAGISGADGETHQGVFDLSYLSMIPNLTVVAPKDTDEFKEILRWSVNFERPLAIRYPRSGKRLFSTQKSPILLGKWEYLTRETGAKTTIIAAGERCLTLATELSKELLKTGVKTDVVNARFVKPLDKELLNNLQTPHVVVLEDNVKQGGLGQSVLSFIAENNAKIACKIFAYRDEFIPQGTVGELMSEYGLNKNEIKDYIASVSLL